VPRADQRERDPPDEERWPELLLLLLALLRSLLLRRWPDDGLRVDRACGRPLLELLLLRDEVLGMACLLSCGSPYGAAPASSNGHAHRPSSVPRPRGAWPTIGAVAKEPAAMIVLVIGLVLFLGAHSTRIVADDWRNARLASLGEKRWKGLFSLVSIVGFVLLVWGYGIARRDPVVLWAAPVWARHLAALLMLVSLVLLAASQVPRNGIKSAVRHPMVLSVKVWAFAHLLANNTVADLVLFGAFLAWALLDYRSTRQRDRAAGTVYPPGTLGRTLATLALGVALWAVFAFWAHGLLFGVRPFP
jgi:uncharacterized membrane protein